MRLAEVKSVYYTISGRGLVKVLLGRGKEVKVPKGLGQGDQGGFREQERPKHGQTNPRDH